jgi:hypothetical protein
VQATLSIYFEQNVLAPSEIESEVNVYQSRVNGLVAKAKAQDKGLIFLRRVVMADEEREEREKIDSGEELDAFDKRFSDSVTAERAEKDCRYIIVEEFVAEESNRAQGR